LPCGHREVFLGPPNPAIIKRWPPRVRDRHAALVSVITIINAFNRVNVVEQPAGDYQPGQFG
jgi:hypothetical protein